MLDVANCESPFSGVTIGVSSNVPPFTSSLQYTASDGVITPVYQNMYSSNTIVANKSFKSSIKRELVYHPTQLKYSE